MLKKREAAVVSKEQASLVRLQEKRDAAVFAITNALEKHRKVSPEDPADVSCDGDNGELSVEEKPPDSVVSKSNLEDIKCSENGNFEVKSYPQLAKLCEEMDSEGLHKFISDNRKNLATLKEEIPWALKAAENPAHLVLESLKGFYLLEAPNVDRKKDSNLLGLRRSCIMLMECLSFLLSNMDMVSVSALISEDIKEQAKLIAEEWKPKLDALDLDASNGNSLEAHAFLQLLATYHIASDFDEEELLRLIPMVSRRRQTADLCRSLGLSEKMPGVIGVLVNSGRQIDAVNLAFAFDLTAQFSPVPLLKAYLKEAKKASSPVKPGNAPLTAQTEFSEGELAALKAVIKCIEEHNLEEQYPVDPLQKRVLQLEKAKADKKGATEAAKPQPKRPRANGAGCGPRVAADKPFYSRVTDRYPQYVYDRPYVYPGPADNHVPTLLGPAPATYNFSPSHGNYFGYQYQLHPRAFSFLHQISGCESSMFSAINSRWNCSRLQQVMDVLHWDGTLSAKNFRIGAFAFAQKWESLNLGFPPWSWVLCPKHPCLASPEEEGYLSLENICISRPNEEDIHQISQIDNGEEETGCSGDEDVDNATLVQSSHHELHYCDFHIVYSNIFRVPVLYIRAYCSDGRPLQLDEIEKELPECSSKELSESKWTFITQEEHPYLKRPWYKLHPCGTNEWMKLLFLSHTANPKFEVVPELYLLSWFSVAGQVFGVRIPSKISN
ncbi:hypothetical protein V6N13_112627 [Hibiscus sabdariffa]|uniref:FRIGIDA-like protein n=1 Tax=Hibiscus sabdariffa TaxID=183260 RepID=A0ABR2TPJ5_9ROSI